jgi:proton-coupled amino acid transporter
MGTVSVALGMIWVMVEALSNPLQFAAIPVSNPAAFSGFFGTVAGAYTRSHSSST